MISVPLPTTVLIVPAGIPAAKIATACQRLTGAGGGMETASSEGCSEAYGGAAPPRWPPCDHGRVAEEA